MQFLLASQTWAFEIDRRLIVYVNSREICHWIGTEAALDLHCRELHVEEASERRQIGSSGARTQLLDNHNSRNPLHRQDQLFRIIHSRIKCNKYSKLRLSIHKMSFLFGYNKNANTKALE